jgi:hypothetical protein
MSVTGFRAMIPLLSGLSCQKRSTLFSMILFALKGLNMNYGLNFINA